MSDRSEAAIALLALGAAGFVLGAPVLGRLGLPRLADLAMASAALCGLAAFAAAALDTLGAARRRGASRSASRRTEAAEGPRC